ncbi:hypothetical protein MRB53_017369 [Persea americana]|uniref:Uncharacterized protein n=1 Tax=Persea americana TaxID=3435 RepID=A0ACC2M4U6_PERAE|nr:hypothetical protein MRB53_017369 [Persea americana]
MASNKSVEVTTRTNADGSVTEKRVETVDYQSQAGQGQIERREVEVVHQYHPTGGNTGNSAGDLLGEAIQSAKEAIAGSGNTNTIQSSK